MLNVLKMVTCNGLNGSIDYIVPGTISTVITIIKIGIPILLIIFGMIDLGKAVMSNDEKEMKSSQTRLIKRILYAVIVFFIVAIVQWIFQIVDADVVEEKGGTKSCLNCFINGNCTTTE